MPDAPDGADASGALPIDARERSQLCDLRGRAGARRATRGLRILAGAKLGI